MHIKNRFKLVVLSLIGLLIIAGGAFYFWQDRSTKTASPSINYEPPSEAEKAEGEQTKLKQNDNYKGAGPTSNTSVIAGKPEISSLTQDGNGAVVVQTKLYDTTWKGCSITFTRKSFTISKSSDVIFNQSFSTCMGFVVNSSEFSEAGEWSVVLKAEQSDGAIITAPTKIIKVIK